MSLECCPAASPTPLTNTSFHSCGLLVYREHQLHTARWPPKEENGHSQECLLVNRLHTSTDYQICLEALRRVSATVFS